MNRLKIVMASMLLALVGIGRSQDRGGSVALTIGDPAPKLEVSKWLKGRPVETFEKGHVYVVECWATWCGPCIMAMPHLSDLARRYRDQATVIGVSVWEGKGKPVADAATIQRFVEGKGANMDYAVAMDDPETNQVANDWLQQAGISGIPATFLIDREGKIAWIGHPVRLDSMLNVVVNNPESYNQEAVRADYQEKRLSVYLPKMLQDQLKNKDYGLAWKTASLLTQDEGQLRNGAWFWSIVKSMLLYDTEKAADFLDEKAADTVLMTSLGYGNDMKRAKVALLERLADLIAEQDGLEVKWYYNAALRLAGKVKYSPDNYHAWSSLARVYARLNEPEKAVEAQQQALDKLQKMQGSLGGGKPLPKFFLDGTKKKLEQDMLSYRDLMEMKQVTTYPAQGNLPKQ